MFAFWPFDFSFSGIAFIMLLLLMWLISAIGEAAKDGAKIAKKVLENDTVQEAGKGILAAWLESVFKK